MQTQPHLASLPAHLRRDDIQLSSHEESNPDIGGTKADFYR